MAELATIVVYWFCSVDLEEEEEILIRISKAHFTQTSPRNRNVALREYNLSTYAILCFRSNRRKAREETIRDRMARIGKASLSHTVVHRTRSTETENYN